MGMRRVSIVMASFEMSRTERFLSWIRGVEYQGTLVRVVIDEAHQLLISGSYRAHASSLSTLRWDIPRVPFTLLSGTLTRGMIRILCEQLNFDLARNCDIVRGKSIGLPSYVQPMIVSASSFLRESGPSSFSVNNNNNNNNNGFDSFPQAAVECLRQNGRLNANGTGGHTLIACATHHQVTAISKQISKLLNQFDGGIMVLITSESINDNKNGCDDDGNDSSDIRSSSLKQMRLHQKHLEIQNAQKSGKKCIIVSTQVLLEGYDIEDIMFIVLSDLILEGLIGLTESQDQVPPQLCQ
jgi:hypothetical protein